MKVIPPLTIDGAKLTSSSVADVTTASTWSNATSYTAGTIVLDTATNSTYMALVANGPSSVSPSSSVLATTPVWTEIGPPAWSSGTTYTAGQRAFLASTNRNYQAVTSSNLNKIPTSNPSDWTDIGPTNKWAMFDYLRNSATKAQSSITVTVTPSVATNAVALVGLKNVSTATVSVNIAGTITTYTKSLTKRASLGWYDYFFDPITFAASTVFDNLPTSINAVITITLTGSNIECGGCILGMSEFIGTVQRGASNDVINFSSVTRDIFGNATMVQRRNVPKTNQTLFLDAAQVNTVRRIRDTLNAKPAVWVGLDDIANQYYFESLLIVGFYRNFSISLDNHIGVTINLELEEI